MSLQGPAVQGQIEHSRERICFRVSLGGNEGSMGTPDGVGDLDI